MIIYEVNLDINNNIADEYIAWLKQHVNDIVSFKGFSNYAIYQVESDNTSTRQYTVQYRVDNRNNLQDYLNNHANLMRSEAIKKFGNQFSANRRIMKLLKTT